MRKRAAFAMLTAATTAVLGLTAPAAQAAEDLTVNSVVVNGGKNVTVGTTHAKTFTVSVTATDDSGIEEADFYLYGPGYGFLQPNAPVTCTELSPTSSRCSAAFTVDPKVDLYDNDQAGTWYVDAFVASYDYDTYVSDKAGSFKLQRFSALTANASPEPVRKGATITVTGKLTRANWYTGTYTTYSKQPVRLQFHKKGGTGYSTVKTVYTSSTGTLKTTVTASADGYWRWSFAGSANTYPVTSKADYVDVQ
ncbi:calcium-binding protein [Streptomyces sp. DH37]|uniref:calcium-binding protein n=1 Tax=Streptomyces sp. DH37 TaxID=3040122 RepID=UPI0024414E0A|nr:calcium-binding protein [Streptomyces sp. DH37]MDG9704186.1 calcium-binding protein [Streptomyces sp. DH37]